MVVGALSVQILELLVVAGFFLYLNATSDRIGSTVVGLSIMFLIFAVGMIGIVRGLLLYRRWARPAVVAFEILVAIFAFSVGTNDLPIALAAGVPAVLALGFLLAPETVRVYEAGIAVQAAELEEQRAAQIAEYENRDRTKARERGEADPAKAPDRDNEDPEAGSTP